MSVGASKFGAVTNDSAQVDVSMMNLPASAPPQRRPDEWQDRYYTETKVNVSVGQMSDAELLATALIEAKPTETELDQKKF